MSRLTIISSSMFKIFKEWKDNPHKKLSMWTVTVDDIALDQPVVIILS